MVQLHAAVVQVHAIDQLVVLLVLLHPVRVLLQRSKRYRQQEGMHGVWPIGSQAILRERDRHEGQNLPTTQVILQVNRRVIDGPEGPIASSVLRIDWVMIVRRRTEPSLYWKTGRCCRMWCFTALISVVRTQYFVVERTKPCAQECASQAYFRWRLSNSPMHRNEYITRHKMTPDAECW